MNSLLARIFGLCVFVLLVHFVAFHALVQWSVSHDVPLNNPFSVLYTVEISEARAAWETGGGPALAAVLKRIATADTGVTEVVFTDRTGRDLVTGQDRSDLLKRALGRSRFGTSGGGPASFARVTEDKTYWLFKRNPSHFLNLGWEEQKRQILAYLIAILPCYLLSSWLIRPLRNLGKAMDAFGEGKLTSRADSQRRDEFGKLGAVFNRMAEHIQSLLVSERRLLRDISHELRSPLARMQVAIELARKGKDATCLDRIQKEADQLGDLLEQLMTLNRAEHDLKGIGEPVRVDNVVRMVVETCEIEAHEKDCILSLEQVSGVRIQGNEKLLRSAVENVLRNAIRYAPRGSTVETSVQEEEGAIRIAIRDFGPGVPEDALRQLGQPFFRVGESRDRNEGGVGLGLSIARRAVQLHGGILEISNANPGLIVEIRLPVMAPAGSIAAAIEPKLQVSGPTVH